MNNDLYTSMISAMGGNPSPMAFAEVQQALKTASPAMRKAINQKIDALVVAVQKQQREAGKSFVSRTRLEAPDYPTQCITVFRVVLANPLTSHNDLAAILAEQHIIAKGTKAWASLIEFVQNNDVQSIA
jgi:glutamate decarboxylase